MSSFLSQFVYPEQSYSRELDFGVQRQERPYGYTMPPPPADTGDYDMKSRESHKEYSRRELHG